MAAIFFMTSFNRDGGGGARGPWDPQLGTMVDQCCCPVVDPGQEGLG